MLYIVGLQNPGSEFKKTRHNIGGEFVEWLYQNHEIISSWEFKKNLKTSIIKISPDKIVTLIIPQVYINNSGEIIWFFKNKSKSEYIQQIICAVDDLETEFEKIKLKTHKDKSHKGHNGLKSIKNHFGEIPHVLSIGIGRPKNDNTLINDFVLGNFSQQEQSKLESIFLKAYELLKTL